MGKGPNVFAHEGMSSGTGNLYKRGYGEGDYSTLPTGYLFSSLIDDLDRRFEIRWFVYNLQYRGTT